MAAPSIAQRASKKGTLLALALSLCFLWQESWPAPAPADKQDGAQTCPQLHNGIDISLELAHIGDLTKTLGDKELTSVKSLLATLKKRGITIKPSFYSLLAKVPCSRLEAFHDRASDFFNNVDVQIVSHTEWLTDIVQSGAGALSNFLTRSKRPLIKLATSDVFPLLVGRSERSWSFSELATALNMYEWSSWGSFVCADSELYRSCMLLFKGRNYSKQDEMDAYLQWVGWNKDSATKRAQQLAVGLMERGRGMPVVETIGELLRSPIWYNDGRFDTHLFDSIASLFYRQGVPTPADVEEMLKWPYWYNGINLDRAKLRAVCLLLKGKGIPSWQEVECFLYAPCWGDSCHFDYRLLKGVSSMLKGAGLPSQEVLHFLVNLPFQHDNSGFDYDIFFGFAALMHGQGLADPDQIKDILSWPCWDTGHGFNRPLFRSVALLWQGERIPERAAVEDLLGWPCWQVDGQFDLELFSSLAAILKRKKLQSAKIVTSIVAWLTQDGKLDRTALRLMVKQFGSNNTVPHVISLEAQQRALLTTLGNGTDVNNFGIQSKVRQVALFLACQSPLRLTLTDFRNFYRQFEDGATSPAAILSRLLVVLLASGEKGVKSFLSHAERSDLPGIRSSLQLFTVNVPTEWIETALKEIPEEQRSAYLNFSREWGKLLSSEEWRSLYAYKNLICAHVPDPSDQRTFLKVLAAQGPDYLEQYTKPHKFYPLLAVFSIASLYELNQTNSPEQMRNILDSSCSLAFQNSQGDFNFCTPDSSLPSSYEQPFSDAPNRFEGGHVTDRKRSTVFFDPPEWPLTVNSHWSIEPQSEPQIWLQPPGGSTDVAVQWADVKRKSVLPQEELWPLLEWLEMMDSDQIEQVLLRTPPLSDSCLREMWMSAYYDRVTGYSLQGQRPLTIEGAFFTQQAKGSENPGGKEAESETPSA